MRQLLNWRLLYKPKLEDPSRWIWYEAISVSDTKTDPIY
jgi:hypothetical protein